MTRTPHNGAPQTVETDHERSAERVPQFRVADGWDARFYRDGPRVNCGIYTAGGMTPMGWGSGRNRTIAYGMALERLITLAENMSSSLPEFEAAALSLMPPEVTR